MQQVYTETMATRKQPRRPKLTPLDETIPAHVPETVGTVMGERSDVYSMVAGNDCQLTVPSVSRKNVTHTVEYHPATRVVSCTCEGYRFAKADENGLFHCKHTDTCGQWENGALPMFPYFWPKPQSRRPVVTLCPDRDFG